MKDQSRNFKNPFLIILIALTFVIAGYGCSPKTYLKSYSDPTFNPKTIKTLVIVKGDTRYAENYVFSQLFTQTAIERKKFFLVQDEYFPKRSVPKSIRKNVDALLIIALTHIYNGNLSAYLPTSIGANIRLIEAKTGKMLWSTTYSYSSYGTGYYAPAIEEAIEFVSNKLIDSIPLEYTVPSPVAKKKSKKKHSSVVLKKSKRKVKSQKPDHKISLPIKHEPLNPIKTIHKSSKIEKTKYPQPIKQEVVIKEMKAVDPKERDISISGVEKVGSGSKKEQLSETLTVKVFLGNLRKSSSKKSTIIATVKKGDSAALIRRKNRWFFIKLPYGRTGWAHETLFL